MSRDLQVTFGGRTAAVRGISFRVEKGETHCLVGESGCGKSVTALAVMSLLARGAQRTANAHELSPATISLRCREREDGAAPRQPHGDDLSGADDEPQPGLHHRLADGRSADAATRARSRAAALERAVELMGRVGITAPEMRLGQFPHQLSGGLRQRVMIAMALMCDPELLIADEPTTALDVTVQAQILRLLAELKREFGLAILLITHDLGIVARVADRVSVMYAGQLVERAPTAAAVRARRSIPTRAGCCPACRCPARARRDQPLGIIPGMVPQIAPGFAGCAFRSRCGYANETCERDIPRRPAGAGA